MKITFILPAIGKKRGKKYIGTWKMEPLTIAVLKALTPSDVETEFIDDRIELPDYDTQTDLVCITVETYTAKRSYRIAARFRKRGIPVVMGKRYAGGIGTYKVKPDKSIFTGKKYLPVSLVETGRGCNHNCEFCSISRFYDSHYHARSHALIEEDITASPYKYFFLVDDNLVANRKNAIELFKRIEPLHIKWAGQGTLSMAKDPELLKAMKKSGCEIILIGFESLDKENLRQMNKSFNYALGERDELVKRVHDAGIGIYATFVFGYDNDDEGTVAQALEFSKKHNFYTAAFNHLLPFPNTRLYDRLRDEGRLLYDKWWLADGYNYGELSFVPKKISPEQLSEACRDARKEFSSFGTVMSRGFASLGRTSPLLWGLFWGMNLRIGGEVDQKMNVPIGENLDEFPK